MGLSMDELEPIKEEFQQKYFREPYINYMTCCGISKLSVMNGVCKKRIDLKNGESLDDLCFSVVLAKKPPKKLELPLEYNGVRVFYHLAEKIMPL